MAQTTDHAAEDISQPEAVHQSGGEKWNNKEHARVSNLLY